ncbi:primosomal protein N' [Oxalobacteraceae bacterium R-40]|uniref:Replication restart protein PriA n=1 Tax=Keguizhuia sedimenti TaxID=3064264 RepID=A0ABU1BKH5_9BURK|nr:primosomal protein N' [Oxalobacteraceae bacterium R-40]
MEQIIVQVALDAPLDTTFDYCWPASENRQPTIGHLATVPFGKRETTGIVVAIKEQSTLPTERLKSIININFELPALSAEWIALCRFAAEYYQRPLGEVALPALPKNLRSLKPAQLEKAYKKLAKNLPKSGEGNAGPASPNLNEQQRIAAQEIAGSKGFTPVLLYGVTGSGKTEVYLHAAQRILSDRTNDGSAQVLILVPEINLTPQLEGHLRARFPDLTIATLHSGLAEGERMQHWLAAHLGQAHIVLGTRLAVMASMPRLRLIIVDEEHDASYKQQEGLRYSARDLAIWRAHQLGIPVVLGSATPSLETWQHAQSGRYRKLELRDRAVKDAVLPKVRVIDMERDKPAEGLTSTLIAALKRRMECGEQSLLYLNRRGYAPVIHCDACGWISNCKRCTAFMVLHRPERRLRCHHCSLELPIPRACPTCGNVDLQPLGRGTQRIEEGLAQLFPQARVLRIDADSTRRKGSAQAAFDQVHRGEVDILIGTQMVAKGHDFKNLTLVGILNPDTALFSHDYRASERLFAQLMQVSGRAGRAAQKEDGNASEVLIQTRYPHHPLYAAAAAHDYDQFASNLLQERKQAGLPPFIYQALLRAEAKDLQTALDFLAQAAQSVSHQGIIVNDPVPMTMTRVANLDRAQLLVESESRPQLQTFLKDWMQVLRATKTRVRWSLEVDPVDI